MSGRFTKDELIRQYQGQIASDHQEILALGDALEEARRQLEQQRAAHLKWMRERPVAPHPKDQLDNLSRALLEDAEAESAALAKALTAAWHALESYARGNDSPELAIEIAAHCKATLAREAA